MTAGALVARLTVLALVLAACGSPAHPADPAHPAGPASPAAAATAPRSHRVPADVGSLVVDDAAFAAFARSLRTDIEAALAGDQLVGEALENHWFVLAMLDALDDHWADAVAKLDRIAAANDNPTDKIMRGLTIRLFADARAHGGGPDAVRAALERKLATMPIDQVRNQLSVLRSLALVLTPELCRKLVGENVGPMIHDGAVPFDGAYIIVFQHYAAKLLSPSGPVIDAVLAAHGIEPAQ